MRSIRSMGAVLAFAALLGACGDATGPAQNPVGTVRFTYSGARSGTFEAVGRFPSATVRGSPSGAWAAAVRLRGRPVPDDDQAVLTANQRRDDARSDDFSVLFVPLQVGTLTCEEADVTPLCPMFAQLRFGVPPLAGDPEAQFVVEAGTVRVTEASGSRVAGTFELVLREVESGAVLLVSGGIFDVPVVEVQFGVVDRIPAR
ncbi:MAG TPA: hypothetical protein VF746_25755 [Longimicrobium sp.]